MEITLPDGGRYTGEVKEGSTPQGQGSCIWPDGSSYDGASHLCFPLRVCSVVVCPRVCRRRAATH